jgi:hypothetical protein
VGSTCDGRQLAPLDNDGILLQCQETEVIRNEIMVFHRHLQPKVQNPQPYTEEMWKKMKLQRKYSKVLFALLEMMLRDDFLKGKICINLFKDPPSNEFNEVLEEWISRSIIENPHMGLVRFKSHYRVNPFLELDSLKDIVDNFSRNVDFLGNKFGRIFAIFFTIIFLIEDPYVCSQID